MDIETKNYLERQANMFQGRADSKVAEARLLQEQADNALKDAKWGHDMAASLRNMLKDGA